MRKIKFTILLTFLLIFAIKGYSQVSLIVDQTNGYTTIQQALDAAENYPGEDIVIKIADGTYYEKLILSSNTYNSLTFEAQDTTTGYVYINADAVANVDSNYAFSVRRSNVSFRKLYFNNVNSLYGRIIHLDGDTVNNVNFDNCTFYGAMIENSDDINLAILYSNARVLSSVYFQNCSFNGGSYSLYFDKSEFIANGIFIYDCVFREYTSSGIYANGLSEIVINKSLFEPFLTTTTHSAIVLDSIINSAAINSNQITLSGSSNVAITANDFEVYGMLSVTNNMIYISGTETNFGLKAINTNYEVLHNSFLIEGGLNTSAALYIIKESQTGYSGSIYNNIFSVNNDGYVLNITDNDSFNSDNNLFNYPNATNIAYINGSNYANFDELVGNNLELNSLSGDPGFLATGDLHVYISDLIYQKGAKIIDINESVLYDFDGDYRKDIPDIGADEIIPGGDVTGVIASDTTWAGIVYINQDITINAGATLYIEPGTEIIFNGNYGIFCFGTIYAEGNKNQKTLFHSSSAEHWAGITLSGSSNSYFNYCSFVNAYKTYGGAIYSENSSNTELNFCSFEKNNADNGAAIYAFNSDFYINGCIFQENTVAYNGGAIYFNQSTNQIASSVFIKNYASNMGGDIYFNLCTNSTIINNTFFKSYALNGGSCIFSYDSYVDISGCYIESMSDSGTIENDSGTVYISSSNVVGGENNISGVNPANIYSIYDLEPQFVDSTSYNFRLLSTSPFIDKGTEITYYETDADGNPRYNGSMTDIGAYEFQGEILDVYAGTDQTVCSDSAYLMAYNYSSFIGTWSAPSGLLIFSDINDPYSTVKNLQKGENIIIWTVSDGFNSLSDSVIITNLKPIANAGPDISLIADPSNFPILDINSCIVTPEAISANESAILTSVNSLLNIVPNTDFYIVAGLERGENILTWRVYLTDDASCYTEDYVNVSLGFSFYPASTAKGLSWNSPTTWNLGVPPQLGDSVTIYGTDIHVTNNDAVSSKLSITTSGSLVIDGVPGKGPTTVRAGKIYVEQNAEKFTKADSARVLISNGTLLIEPAAGDATPGLIVGTMGNVVLNPIDGGIAEIQLGKNKQIIVKQNAVYKTSSDAPASLKVTNGGRIYVEQTAEKLTDGASNNSIYVGSGGKIYVEQTAEKATANGGSSIVLGKGSKIYVEQTAEKVTGDGGKITVSGGRIYVEQTAEKAAIPQYFDFNIGNGGLVELLSTADSSIIDVNKMSINGGKLVIGNVLPKIKPAGNQNVVKAGKIYVEQNAEKSFAIDTAIIIGSDGTLEINMINYVPGKLTLASNSAMHIFEGGELLIDNNSYFVMPRSASFIDMNQYSAIPATQVTPIGIGSYLYSSSFTGINSAEYTHGQFLYWDEPNNDFYDYSNSTLKPGNGYFIKDVNYNFVKDLVGTLNAGAVSVPLSIDNRGVNLVGNPYPSAIDFDKLNLNSNIQTAIYFYDFDIHNYRIYQKDGLNLLYASNIIPTNQAFFVVADYTSALDFTNDSRVHFYTTNNLKAADKSIVFSITDNVSTDNLGFVFKDGANDAYVANEDAIELNGIDNKYISFYSVSSDNKILAIDGRPMPNSNTNILIKYVSQNSGVVTITLDQNNYPELEEINLFDTDANTFNNFVTNGSIQFNYDTPGVEKEFYLSFGKFTDLEQIPNANNVKIFAFNQKLSIISDNETINTVEVYSANGVKIINELTNSNFVEINTNLKPGVYVVKALTNSETYTSKVIIK